MTAEPSAWDTYVGAVMRIEAPGGVIPRDAEQLYMPGEFADSDGKDLKAS